MHILINIYMHITSDSNISDIPTVFSQSMRNSIFCSFYGKQKPPKQKAREVYLAEKERFELSKPFWGLHDFQSCALDQARRLLHSSIKMLNDCIIFGFLCQHFKTLLMLRLLSTPRSCVILHRL